MCIYYKTDQVKNTIGDFTPLAHYAHFLYPRIMSRNENRTVWSSDQGDLRKEESKGSVATTLPPDQQTAYLHRKSKGRGDKPVTLIKNLILTPVDMKELAKKLKAACGSGGTVKNGIIEIQGEQREKITEVLEKLGYRVKVAGG